MALIAVYVMMKVHVILLLDAQIHSLTAMVMAANVFLEAGIVMDLLNTAMPDGDPTVPMAQMKY